jgi:hypothetical protein
VTVSAIDRLYEFVEIGQKNTSTRAICQFSGAGDQFNGILMNHDQEVESVGW